MVDVRYRPAGSAESWLAVVSGSALAVLPAEVTPHTAEAAWRRLAQGGIAALLEALTGAFGTSLTAIPPFALVVVEDGAVRVAVRGALELERGIYTGRAFRPAPPETRRGGVLG